MSKIWQLYFRTLYGMVKSFNYHSWWRRKSIVIDKLDDFRLQKRTRLHSRVSQHSASVCGNNTVKSYPNDTRTLQCERNVDQMSNVAQAEKTCETLLGKVAENSGKGTASNSVYSRFRIRISSIFFFLHTVQCNIQMSEDNLPPSENSE